MEMISVRSQAIAAVGYDPASMRMQIRFTSGPTIYSYCGVPLWIYDGIMAAPPKGSYFDLRIRDRYHC